jgi:hypothetical protein
MWFLNFIPDALLHWFVHGVVALGLIMYVIGYLRNFPIVGPYAGISRQLGTLVLLFGIFFEGGYGVEMMYRAKIADLQAQIKVAEQQSKDANTKIEQKVNEKVKLIKDNVNANSKAIEANRTSINAECKLSDVAWLWYNRASQNELAGGSVKSNGTSK